MKEYILLMPNNIKKEVIKSVREKYFNYNIKFLSLEEFIKKVTFDYDEKTIYEVMNKYNVKYDSAIIYLDNLYYINDSLNNTKMNKLKEIKEYLDSNKLLIYNNLFKEYAKDKEIYIYGYDYINKYYKNILKDYNYKAIDSKKSTNIIDKVYYSDYIDDEVIFIANKICELINNKIDINNIKIIYSNEYDNVIKRIFKLFNTPIEIKTSIYSIYEVKNILNNLYNIEEYLDNINDEILREKIINIINKYYFIGDKEKVKDLIINDLKNSFITIKEGIKKINIYDYISDNDYVFLLGYNKENIPRIYKDNDYFSDKEKDILSLDTSGILNKEEKNKILNWLYSIKNLYVSYKLYDINNIYTKCDLIDNIKEEKIINNISNYSNMINKVYLANKLDNLIKYDIKDADLDILHSNYNIRFMEYDNSFKGIDKNNLYKYLNNKLVLSYTALDNYNRCSFKYYLDNILKLNIIKDDFAIIIGNVCHYILSCMDNNDFEVNKYFNEYLKEQRVFTKRELTFLLNIKEELIFIIDTIRKQLSYGKLDKKLYEEKVFINKDNTIKVTFMGVIDKVLYKEDNDNTYLVVIDYKTGNTEIKLNNIKYGIDMQLPIYLYLSKNMKFKNIKILGFYLQKLLNNNLDNTKDYNTARENNLKLEGYSINNENLLSLFDSTYNDSKLIKSMKTSNNGFYSYSKVLDEDKIDDIVDNVDKKIDSTIDNIVNAKFDINPKVINGDNVSCKYCQYKDICFKKEKDIIYINDEVINDE